MLEITFEHSHDEYPVHTEGPFVWIEQIGANLFGCRKEGQEAEEIASLNDDGCTWDAGPEMLGSLAFGKAFGKSGIIPTVQRKRRKYTRWTISTV